MELEEKLCNFIDRKTRENIYKSALVENRNKTRNEEIFYNIDKITTAININSKIQFNYVELKEEVIAELVEIGKSYKEEDLNIDESIWK